MATTATFFPGYGFLLGLDVSRKPVSSPTLFGNRRSRSDRKAEQAQAIRDEGSVVRNEGPRWTREVENPFDVPTSAFKDAIP